MSGLRTISESYRERSRRTPGSNDASTSDWADGDTGGDAAVGFLLGEVRCSITDLHSVPSLECLRHVAFFAIFSSAGIRTCFKRESASEEAIPELEDWGGRTESASEMDAAESLADLSFQCGGGGSRERNERRAELCGRSAAVSGSCR